ncbi:hypothetical protein [Aromatoleum diolicum]|uniref:Uncharacterized protein n=1 Tax=Aromatoleum diolicum TaxID=75796 RepID=A0ABX1Q5C3_9RHOO|nr:hypothetical protein [Aromatoleum diolicum]NMG73551.1 hypothetical protein [Aromatoleum diolicum]
MTAAEIAMMTAAATEIATAATGDKLKPAVLETDERPDGRQPWGEGSRSAD